MIKQDLARVAIELAVKRGIEDIRTDHKRSIRRLVDLGDHFANGRFHKYFFKAIQTMLEDEDSAYYHLVSQVVDRVDAQTISTIGINVGYNSWTLGAKTIRANEAELGFNIPWAISFFIDGGVELDRVEAVIEQGKQLGIYTYLFHLEQEGMELEPLMELFERQADCGFALFHKKCPAARLPAEQGRNLLQLFAMDEHFFACCEKLADGKNPYGSYLEYDNNSAELILSGEWIRQLEREECFFAAAIPAPGCGQDTQDAVQRYINEIRLNQQHAVFVSGLYSDLLFVDQVISQEPCFFGVAVDGQAFLNVQNRVPSPYNIKETPLQEILSKTMPRVTYQPEPE